VVQEFQDLADGVVKVGIQVTAVSQDFQGIAESQDGVEIAEYRGLAENRVIADFQAIAVQVVGQVNQVFQAHQGIAVIVELKVQA
jgi:hypothetical protein